MANASRHAGATHVGVNLSLSRSEVALTVEDDGRGFDPGAVVPHAEGGYGILGIRERAGKIRGTVDLETAPGAGTRLVVRVPL